MVEREGTGIDGVEVEEVDEEEEVEEMAEELGLGINGNCCVGGEGWM